MIAVTSNAPTMSESRAMPGEKARTRPCFRHSVAVPLQRRTPMKRVLSWTGGIVAGIVLVLIVAAFFIDEPLRRTMERQLNNRLEGYTARIGKLDFHPIGFSLDLEELTLIQQAHPDPPVATIETLEASVQWRALLRGALVANFTIKRPRFYIDREHLQKEASDEVPVDQRGWQEALQAIYPLKINELTIADGAVTYVEAAGKQALGKPIEVTGINATAANIRNVRSPDRVYPSDLVLEAMVFGNGRVRVEGNADFLAVPHLGVKADLALENIDLGQFRTVLQRYHMAVKSGVLSATGTIEYAPQVKQVRLGDVQLAKFVGDYVHTPRNAGTGKRAVKAAGEAAAEVNNAPDLVLEVERLVVRDATVGFVNKAAKGQYRVFLAGTDLDVTNLSNQEREGTSVGKLSGKFMGSGALKASATFRPERQGPDFDLSASIENTDMRTMNDLLRAHGRLDVVAGFFSLYSEIKVKNRYVNGYVKPLFRNMDVYDPAQDREKGTVRKLYERVVEGVSKVLENKPRDEVATQTDISGPLEKPNADTWQVIANLVQNAFIRAILPGFDREIRGARRG
jgi:hypothetical protein